MIDFNAIMFGARAAISGGGGDIVFINSVIAGSPANEHASQTPDFDTTGANFIFIALEYYSGITAVPTVTDSFGNTYTLSSIIYGDDPAIRFCYCFGATVGADHQVTVSGTTTYSSFLVAAFSGPTSLQEYTETANSDGQIVPPITPSGAGALLLTILKKNFSEPETIDNEPYVVLGRASNSYYKPALAYLIQTTAEESEPIWIQDGLYTVSPAILVCFNR